MSNIERFENTKQLIYQAEQDFRQLAQIHGAVAWEREASFAVRALKENNYLSQTAYSNPDSLKQAVLDVAAVGLSLSPVYKLAYLVPRDGKVCLDVSYRGYIQLAIDIGAIKWAKAEVVRANDTFVYNGFESAPEHTFEPFGDRGEIKGAYCVAKTHDGEYLTELMPIEQINSIRDRTAGWKAYQSGKTKTNPWASDTDEMIKKTVIKRAYKSWPMRNTKESERFVKAVDITNQADPVDFEQPPEPKQIEGEDGRIEYMRSLLEKIGRTEDKFIEYQARVCNRKIESLSDLTDHEMGQAVSMLEQTVEKHVASEKKHGASEKETG